MEKLLLVGSTLVVLLMGCQNTPDLYPITTSMVKLEKSKIVCKADTKVEDPFFDGKEVVWLISEDKLQLPQSLIINECFMGEAGLTPPWGLKVQYVAFVRNGDVLAVVGIIEGDTDVIKIVEFERHGKTLKIFGAIHVNNPTWCKHIRDGLFKIDQSNF